MDQDHNEGSSSSRNPTGTPQNFLDKSLFSPFLVNTLKVKGNPSFTWESACFNSKNNMIIACSGGTMQFYDTATFEPFKGRESLKLPYSVSKISFHPDTDTYLLGCTSGSIYKYNVSKNELKELAKWPQEVLGIAFLDETFYIFSYFNSTDLYVANINDGNNILKFALRNMSSHGLYHLSKKKLLFSGLKDGSVRIYRTNKLPHLKAICSVKTGGWLFTIQCINVNGKDYVITASPNDTVKIWHFLKGKMRLLKVLQNEKGGFCSFVYLENYKMIATTCQGNSIKFWRFPSMKQETMIYLGDGVLSLFLVKEKNLIGITNDYEEKIEFIQLHSRLHNGN